MRSKLGKLISERSARACPLGLLVGSLAGLFLLAIGAPSPASTLEGDTLIPRTQLFNPKQLRDPRISPDGRTLAYLAPDHDGVANIWVRTMGETDDRLVTRDAGHGIQVFRWAEDSSHLLYEHDNDGNEIFHVHVIDLKGNDERDLTPYPGIRAQNILTSAARPQEILVGLNRRDPRVFDMYRIDVTTGKASLDAENPGDILSWTTDSRFAIRAATAFDAATGDTIIRVRDKSGDKWRELARWSFENSLMFGQASGASVIAGFAPNDDSLYVISAAHSDTGHLVRIDVRSGRELETIAADPHSDVAVDPTAADYRALFMISPVTHRVQAVGFEYLTWTWQAADGAVRGDLAWLGAQFHGVPIVVSRDRGDRLWIVQLLRDDEPNHFFSFDRRRRLVSPLRLPGRPPSPERLANVRPVVIRARDGLALVSYLTLPKGVEGKNLPMVVYPHGGPWYRDDWGFDPVVQLLANRGYAVLQVNFRGSTGFGKSFLNAGNHQFGLAMEDDIEDGARWAIDQGIADPKRVAIMGYSGGGYATLRGLTRTPKLYACGVDIVGPADLGALLSSFAPWMQAVKSRWIRRIGDVEGDSALRQQLSPLYEADKIQVPVLVGAGVQDPRVAIAQSESIVAALRKNRVPVVYVVYPDEGHGFSRPENNIDFFGRVEEFLATYLHGKTEPWQPVPGASAQVH
jgi:dipeptidyl aminopeptidase/acylaminoacyl peptidase